MTKREQELSESLTVAYEDNRELRTRYDTLAARLAEYQEGFRESMNDHAATLDRLAEAEALLRGDTVECIRLAAKGAMTNGHTKVAVDLTALARDIDAFLSAADQPDVCPTCGKADNDLCSAGYHARKRGQPVYWPDQPSVCRHQFMDRVTEDGQSFLRCRDCGSVIMPADNGTEAP